MSHAEVRTAPVVPGVVGYRAKQVLSLVETLMGRGFERNGAIRFACNRYRIAERDGAEEFVQWISEGKCVIVRYSDGDLRVAVLDDYRHSVDPGDAAAPGQDAPAAVGDAGAAE